MFDSPLRPSRPTLLASGLPSAALLWVGIAVIALLVGCGGGSSAPPEPPSPQALQASQPGELMGYVRNKLALRHAERLASPGLSFVLPPPGVGVAAGPGFAGSAVASDGLQRSGSTVQEQGVDEDDLLKTDGNSFFTLVAAPELRIGEPGARLVTYSRRADGGIDSAGALPLLVESDAVVSVRGMLLASGAARVAALGESQKVQPFDWCPPGLACPTVAVLPAPRYAKPAVNLDLVDVGKVASPLLNERVRIDGRLVGVRMIGDLLYLVTQHTPQLAVEALPTDATQAEREALLARLTAADVLPTLRIGNAAEVPLVRDTDCYVHAGNASLGIEITTVTAIDLRVGITRRASRCFLGGAEALYVSTNSVYLATTRAFIPLNSLTRPEGMTTDIHKLGLNQLAIDYRGSGEVKGHLGWDRNRSSFRLSEWNGDLRVLSFTGEQGWWFGAPTAQTASSPPSPATLTVLRERASDRSLQTVSTLPNSRRPEPIGKVGEQVYAVRFIGNRGYVVTFRRTDPLYVLDLADPADPRTVGELEVPGFSEDLYPVGAGLLLGVGRDADPRGFATGVKLSLFDVANPAQPRELSSMSLGGSGSSTALDWSRQGINLFARGSTTRVTLPMMLVNVGDGVDRRGLFRFEVDTAARSLRQRPMISAAEPAAQAYPGLDRAVQVGEHGYYFTNGRLQAFDW